MDSCVDSNKVMEIIIKYNKNIIASRHIKDNEGNEVLIEFDDHGREVHYKDSKGKEVITEYIEFETKE